jgi:hypothetical protein
MALIAPHPDWSKIMADEVSKGLFNADPSYPSHQHVKNAQIVADHTHSYAGAQQTTIAPTRWSEGNLLMMLGSRLGWGFEKCKFRRVVPCRVTDEKIVLFIVTNTDAVTLEDDAYLYPSDALVSQVRLLEEAL